MVDRERAWWDDIATGPDLMANIFDTNLGTTDDCVNEILSGFTGLPAGPILDLGCGVGRLTKAFARKYDDRAFVGVDISPNMVDRARVGAERLANVEFTVGDGRTIPYPDESFAAAWSMCVFQHVPEDACAGYVGEAARVLMPGGRFRFQSVLGSENGFLSYQTVHTEMCGWCEDAGLEVVASEASRLHWEWWWITARKG